MLKWFRRRNYKNEVIGEMMAIFLMPDNRFQAFLKEYFPGAFTAIRSGYDRGQNPTELAITMSAAVLASMIEALDDERVERIQAEVMEWANDPDAIEDLNGTVENAQDGFAGRIKWAIAYVARLERSQQLDEYFLDLFSGEVFGALAGKSEGDRADERRSRILLKALRAG